MNTPDAKEIIRIVRSRGLRIEVDRGPPPMPALRGPQSVADKLATPALLEALRAWRLEIIDEILRETVSNGAV